MKARHPDMTNNPLDESALTLSRREMLLRSGAVAAGVVTASNLLVPRASAATGSFDYYIGPNGSDSNPGTEASPWAITAINSKRSTYAGKRVGLLDGVYNINSITNTGGYWSHPGLQVASGTASSPTLIAAVNTRGAILDGTDGSGNIPTTESPAIGQGYGGASGASGGYVTIDGLVVRNMYGSGIQFWYSGTQSLTYVANVKGVIVRNCEVYNIKNRNTGTGNNVGAVRFQAVNGGLIQNCELHDVYGGNTTEREGYGVLTFTSTNCIVEYCTTYNVCHGIYHKQIGNSGHTTRYCYLETDGRGGAAGVQESDGGGVGTTQTFHNNIVNSRQPWDGRSFVSPPVNNFHVYNNTFYSASGFGDAGVFLPSLAGLVRFYNNIIARGSTVGYMGDLTVCVGALTGANYNCYPSGAKLGLSAIADWGSPTLYSIDTWKSRTGLDGNSLTQDPMLSSPRSRAPETFKLASGSPCKGLGRVGGTSGGAATDAGAWGNGATQIGATMSAKPVMTPLKIS